jgi:hypothetical protein
MEIRTAKKKKIAPTSLGIMDEELVDTVHNIRMKSNEFRDFGKTLKSNPVAERCTAIQKQNQ